MRNTDTTDRVGRGVTINLRADTATRTLIDRAAEQVGKNRSEFMLEAARREATGVCSISDCFCSMRRPTPSSCRLGPAPTENRRLRRLLRTKAAWDA